MVDGLPCGLMIVGRHFEDATCLRAGRAYEAMVGGFPARPATVGRDIDGPLM